MASPRERGQRVGQHLDARHRLVARIDRGGQGVAQPLGRHADQHVAAGQALGGDGAAQHVDVGHLIEGARRAGIADQQAAVAASLGRQGVDGRGHAAQVRVRCLAAGLQRASARCGYRRRADAGVQEGVAQHAVGVDRGLGGAQPRGAAQRRRPAPARPGRRPTRRCARTPAARPAPRIGQRLRQQRVLPRVGVGFAEHQVQHHRPRPRRGQPLEQRGVHGARPGPAADGLDAGVVDGDDHDVRRRRPAPEAPARCRRAGGRAARPSRPSPPRRPGRPARRRSRTRRASVRSAARRRGRGRGASPRCSVAAGRLRARSRRRRRAGSSGSSKYCGRRPGADETVGLDRAQAHVEAPAARPRQLDRRLVQAALEHACRRTPASRATSKSKRCPGSASQAKLTRAVADGRRLRARRRSAAARSGAARPRGRRRRRRAGCAGASGSCRAAGLRASWPGARRSGRSRSGAAKPGVGGQLQAVARGLVVGRPAELDAVAEACTAPAPAWPAAAASGRAFRRKAMVGVAPFQAARRRRRARAARSRRRAGRRSAARAPASAGRPAPASKRASRATWPRQATAPGIAGSVKRTRMRSCRVGRPVSVGRRRAAASAARPGRWRSTTVPKPASTRWPGAPAWPPTATTPPSTSPRVPASARGDAELGAAHAQHALRRVDAKTRLAGAARARPRPRRGPGPGARRCAPRWCRARGAIRSSCSRLSGRRRSRVPSTRRSVTWPSGPVRRSSPSVKDCPAASGRGRALAGVAGDADHRRGGRVDVHQPQRDAQLDADADLVRVAQAVGPGDLRPLVRVAQVAAPEPDQGVADFGAQHVRRLAGRRRAADRRQGGEQRRRQKRRDRAQAGAGKEGVSGQGRHDGGATDHPPLSQRARWATP